MCPNPVVVSKRWNQWNRFCSRSCAGKHVAAYLKRTASSAQRAQWGREGGMARKQKQRGDLCERLAHLTREDAVWQAWKLGREASKKERQRQGAAAGRHE